jgi:hypothetical protein
MNTGACAQSGGLFKAYSKNPKNRALATTIATILFAIRHKH